MSEVFKKVARVSGVWRAPESLGENVDGIDVFLYSPYRTALVDIIGSIKSSRKRISSRVPKDAMAISQNSGQPELKCSALFTKVVYLCSGKRLFRAWLIASSAVPTKYAAQRRTTVLIVPCHVIVRCWGPSSSSSINIIGKQVSLR